MNEELARLNRIYPNGRYVQIEKYDPSQWVDREYDSHFDSKNPVEGTSWSRHPMGYEEAQQSADDGYRIGWIVPTGLVVVDIDSKAESEKLSKILKLYGVKYQYNTSSRGMHYIFRDSTGTIDNKARLSTAIGLTADYRSLQKGYIVLPCNDPHRKWGEWESYVDELPFYLQPVGKANSFSFVGMNDGDGRNDALFNWRIRLEKTKKFSKSQVETCIRIINDELFEKSISNDELYKTVLRDISINTDKRDKDNLFNQIANEVIQKIDLISYYDQFYRFNGIYYKPIETEELEQYIHYEISPNLSQAARKEIISFLKLKTRTPIEEFNKHTDKIACQNGVINLRTGVLEPGNKTEINTIYIPQKYNPDPEFSPRVDDFFKALSNGDMLKMEFLYQIVGYCLLKENRYHKFFVFQGSGGTGKSTYTNLIQGLVGEHNCSNVSLSDMDKDYYLASMMGKLVNVDDDVEGKALSYTGRFKSMVSGEVISVREIYKAVEKHKPFSTLIFNCNKLPKIMDRTSGLYRRIVLIELNHKVDNPNPNFVSSLTEKDYEYLLFKAVQGIKTVIAEGHFRISISEEKLMNLFKRRQSPINEWIYENSICLRDLHCQSVRPLYSQFVAWCSENGYAQPMSNYTFKEEICTIFDMEVRHERGEKGVSSCFFKPGKFDPEYRPF